MKYQRDGNKEGPIWVFTLFGIVFVFLIAVFMVRALLKGNRSCQLSSTSHPLHKPWLKSLSPPVIFSYPSNTTSACRWRVCSPAVHLSVWYVTLMIPRSRHLHCRCSDHQQQKIRVVYSFLIVSSHCLIYTPLVRPVSKVIARHPVNTQIDPFLRLKRKVVQSLNVNIVESFEKRNKSM